MYKSEKTDDDFDLIPDGVYEATAEEVNEKPSYDGKSTQLEIKWRLSSNNRILFDHIGKDRKFPNDYSHWKISNILFACRCPDANTTDDLIRLLLGKKAMLTVSSEYYDKTGKTYNRIKEYSQATDSPVGDSNEANGKEIDTSDLPF